MESEKIIGKWFLIILISMISLNVLADDEPDQSKKKTPKSKVETKSDTKIKTNGVDGEDTLVYDRINEDTLIFADDEKDGQSSGIKPKQKPGELAQQFKKAKAVAIDPVIFPNPSLGESVLELNPIEDIPTVITITSINGVLIKTESFSGRVYKLKGMSEGTYIVKIQCGDQVVQKRLFVK